jgi:hypothetical protein
MLSFRSDGWTTRNQTAGSALIDGIAGDLCSGTAVDRCNRRSLTGGDPAACLAALEPAPW